MTTPGRNPREVEAAVLAEIGAALFRQNLRVRVVLPPQLADASVRAWVRDDTDPVDAAPTAVTKAAGQLALIGLAIDERGTRQPDGSVVVELDAWQIGNALDAAETADLLDV